MSKPGRRSPAAHRQIKPRNWTTSHLLAGDHVDARDLAGATPVDHWYFLSGLDVWSPPATAAAVMLGDSLTDGRGSTTNGNDRWPDLLSDRLRAVPVGYQSLADAVPARLFR